MPLGSSSSIGDEHSISFFSFRTPPSGSRERLRERVDPEPVRVGGELTSMFSPVDSVLLLLSMSDDMLAPELPPGIEFRRARRAICARSGALNLCGGSSERLRESSIGPEPEAVRLGRGGVGDAPGVSAGSSSSEPEEDCRVCERIESGTARSDHARRLKAACAQQYTLTEGVTTVDMRRRRRRKR